MYTRTVKAINRDLFYVFQKLDLVFKAIFISYSNYFLTTAATDSPTRLTKLS